MRDDGKVRDLNDEVGKIRALLKKGEGDGTSDGMEHRIRRLEDDMREVRTDVRGIRSDLAEIKGQLSRMPSTATVFGATFTAAVAIISVTLAVLAFAGSRFDGGLGLSDWRMEQQIRADELDRRHHDVLSQLDALRATLATRATPAPGTPSE